MLKEENIAELRASYNEAGNPVISPSLAEGVAVPHVIYDIERNEAYASIGTSHDTSEFACDSIRHWWYNYGK